MARKQRAIVRTDPYAEAGRIDESLLVRIWQAQRIRRAALRTLDGQPVDVVYPGRRRPGGGPDFQGALIALNGRLSRGGVELHLRTGDWARHGHDGDPAYDATILHVVLRDDGSAPPRTHGGRAVPTVALEAWLDAPLDVLAATLPADPMPWPQSEQGPCAPDRTVATARLEAAGLTRYELRQAHYTAALADRPAADLLLGGLVEAMGYGANREPARELAARLPAYAALHALAASAPRRRVVWQAGLLGLAGLLPSQGSGALSTPLEAELERGWRWLAPSLSTSVVPGPRWRLAGLRPVSHPARRLAGLGALLADRPLNALLADAARTLLAQPPARAARLLAAPLLVEATDGGWVTPADSPRPDRATPALIGPERAADAVVNVLLPLLAAWGSTLDHAALTAAARACYLACPAAGDNERLRHMRRQILGADDRSLTRTACLQQGLLHIYSQTCDARRCAACVVGPSPP